MLIIEGKPHSKWDERTLVCAWQLHISQAIISPYSALTPVENQNNAESLAHCFLQSHFNYEGPVVGAHHCVIGFLDLQNIRKKVIKSWVWLWPFNCTTNNNQNRNLSRLLIQVNSKSPTITGSWDRMWCTPPCNLPTPSPSEARSYSPSHNSCNPRSNPHPLLSSMDPKVSPECAKTLKAASQDQSYDHQYPDTPPSSPLQPPSTV